MSTTTDTVERRADRFFLRRTVLYMFFFTWTHSAFFNKRTQPQNYNVDMDFLFMPEYRTWVQYEIVFLWTLQNGGR